MTFLFRRAERAADLSVFAPPSPLEFQSPAGLGDRSLQVSAVWAARRVRAQLVSTMPCDVFRRLPDGRAVEVAKPTFFDRPSAMFDWIEWLQASQMDLDAHGNAFGVVVARSGDGWPSQIELTPAADWSVTVEGGAARYRFRGVAVDNAEVWHERQNVVPGLPVGLSPVAHAALTVEHALSASEFALAWFSSGAAPSGVLRNRERTLDPATAQAMKERFRVATQRREPFVAGADWEWTAAAGAEADARYLESMGATAVDIARFYNVPADLIDAASKGESITYANISERMLQFLVINLGPTLTAREAAFSRRLLPAPRFFKFNSDALLRMDPAGKTRLLGDAINARIRTPDEARAILDLPPLTEDDYGQFDRLFGGSGVGGDANVGV